MKAIKIHVITLSCLAVMLIFTGNAFSTEASISISEVEGELVLNVSATFTSYTVCNPDDSTDCITSDSGSIYVYHDGFEIASESGEDSITWSDTLDAGAMQQGENRFTVKAIDFEGRIVTEETELEIDNTPIVTITDPGSVDGAFDLQGTCSFIEYLDGSEGSISISIDGFDKGQKVYEGTEINWSYSDVTGQMINGGLLCQGEHRITVRAIAANDTYSDEIWSFFTDNTPVVTITNPGTVDGEFNITGDVVFKENIDGIAGVIYIYIDDFLYAQKECKDTNISFSYSDITGQSLNAEDFGFGEHRITVRAVSANEAISISEISILIPENE